MQARPDILKRILERKSEEVIERQSLVSLKEIIQSAGDKPDPRPFYGAVTDAIAAGKPAVIAEIKRPLPVKDLSVQTLTRKK